MLRSPKVEILKAMVQLTPAASCESRARLMGGGTSVRSAKRITANLEVSRQGLGTEVFGRRADDSPPEGASP